MHIRQETPADAAQVWAVNQRAFERPDEANLVQQLTAAGAVTLSLVAEEDGQVLGHILFSPMTLDGEHGSLPAVGVGPLAVLPERQGQGIGAQLIRSGLDECRRLGHELVFVLGHPDYYPRFGFASTAPMGIRCEYDVPPEAFMLVELQPGALAGRQGIAHYRPEFNGV